MDDINFKNLQNFMYTQEIYFQEYQFTKHSSILITSKFMKICLQEQNAIFNFSRQTKFIFKEQRQVY